MPTLNAKVPSLNKDSLVLSYLACHYDTNGEIEPINRWKRVCGCSINKGVDESAGGEQKVA
jgi:hypothetical protein